MRLRVLGAVACALLLAGCGGAHSTLPSVGDPGTPRQAQSTNVVLYDATLWYGDGASLLATPLMPSGVNAELDTSYARSGYPDPARMTVAPDGTVYDLARTGDGSGWRLNLYAPGSHGAVVPEQVISGTGAPLQVVLVGDGIDVLSVAGTGSATLATYGYASGDNPSPVRTLALGAGVTDVAADGDDRLYVAHADGTVAVYKPVASGSAAPLRTVATRAQPIDSIAVAKDGTLYVEAQRAKAVRVFAYAAGASGPAPSRTVGPFARPAAGTATGGITLDSAGNLYVGFEDASMQARVDVFGPTASGSAAPARSIATPTRHGRFTSLAIGPAARAAVATLYVAAPDQVDAFPTTASGTTPPSRTISGWYVAPGYTPAARQGTSAVGIASAADGTLDVLVDAADASSGYSCRGIVESPTASGTSGVRGSFPCSQVVGLAVARGTGGEIVTVQQSNAGDPNDLVERSLNGTVTGSFPVGDIGTHRAVAVGPDGDIYVAAHQYGSHPAASVIEAYPPNTVGLASPAHSFTIPGTVTSLAFCPDGTLYAGSDTASSSNGTATGTGYAYAFAPGAADYASPARAIGPFADLVTALACNDKGVLFAGFDPRTSGGTAYVRAYAAQANGQAAPLRTLLDPVPASDPAGQHIVGLAVGTTAAK